MEFTEAYFHKRGERRIDRLERLDQRSGDKYCWANLVTNIGMVNLPASIAIEVKDECRTGEKCKRDSIGEGSCWCGKFRNGHLKE